MPLPFKMKLLQKSCCGCTVKTGALVICYITLIQAVVLILNILSNTNPELSGDKYLTNEYKRDITWFAVVAIVIVAHALYGIYKKKPGYMVPFLIYKLVILFSLTLMLGFAPAIVENVKATFARDDVDVLPCFIVTVLLAIAVQAYALLILFSHHQNVRRERSDAANAPNVGFTAAVPEAEASFRYPNPYDNEAQKKQPPPPYAV